MMHRWMAVLCLSASAVAGAGDAPLRDPFARPAAVPVVRAPATGADSTVPAAPPWQPQLRAVVLDGARSLVNLSGVILAPGDSTHGYRLVSVDARSVVLLRDGKKTTIKLETVFANQDGL